MRELYIEGVAIHGGPESCVGVRKGAGEALTGVRVGWAIEPRNHLVRGADVVSRGGRPHRWLVRGADVVSRGGRPHRWQRYRELPGDPARSENPCMRGISMRENREVPRLPARLISARAARGRLRPHA
jgi:hypothetical protein